MVNTTDIISKINEIESQINSSEAFTKISSEIPSPKPPKKVVIEQGEEDEEEEDVYDESQMAALDTDFNRNDFKSVWDKACQAIKTAKTSVGLYISEGEAVNFDGKVLTIGFYPGFTFHKESLETKINKKLVQDTFSELLGKKITINLVDIASKKKETLQKVKKPQLKEEKKESDSPIVASAQKLFDGLFVKRENKGFSS
jgi:hypothetical protein